MDYKLLIILLALLFLIILLLLYREVNNLRDHVNDTLGNVAYDIKHSCDGVVSRLQGNMIRCVRQIKGVSNDNLDQLRKITLLNHQPITKMSNHFTETDDSEVHTNLVYLSEARDNNQIAGKNIFHSKNGASIGTSKSGYYMSEDSGSKHSDSDDEESDDEEELTQEEKECEGGVCKIQVAEVKPKQEAESIAELDIPLYKGVNAKVMEKDEYEEEDSDEYEDEDSDEFEDEDEDEKHDNSEVNSKEELIRQDSDDDQENDHSFEEEIPESDQEDEKDQEKQEQEEIKQLSPEKIKNKLSRSINLENSFIDIDESSSDEKEKPSPVEVPCILVYQNKDMNEIEIDIQNMLNGSKLFPNIPREVVNGLNEEYNIEGNIDSDELYEDNYNENPEVDTDTISIEKKIHNIDMTESLNAILNKVKVTSEDEAEHEAINSGRVLTQSQETCEDDSHNESQEDSDGLDGLLGSVSEGDKNEDEDKDKHELEEHVHELDYHEHTSNSHEANTDISSEQALSEDPNTSSEDNVEYYIQEEPAKDSTPGEEDDEVEEEAEDDEDEEASFRPLVDDVVQTEDPVKVKSQQKKSNNSKPKKQPKKQAPKKKTGGLAIMTGISDKSSAESSEESGQLAPDEVSIVSKSSRTSKVNFDGHLKSADSYSQNDLKNIAKTLNLPITYKENEKWKPYKKEELYKNIKNLLDSKAIRPNNSRKAK